MEWFLNNSPDVIMRFDRDLRHLYVTKVSIELPVFLGHVRE